MKAPLHVHMLFHPTSIKARQLATKLAEDWMGVPGLPGLRIPVFLSAEDGFCHPGSLELDTAEHSLVVMLVDSHMTNRVTGEGDAWAEHVRWLCTDYPPGGRHLALPVALDTSAFEFDETLKEKHFLALDGLTGPDQQSARLGFTMAVRALQLLGAADFTDLEPKTTARIRVFVSHAKKDLDKDKRDPVRWAQAALRDVPVEDWFDARDIREGANFEKEIREGLEKSDAMVVFLTDAWATRPWCRNEALIAKEVGTPIVVVDALADGEPRSFPYSGNCRLLRWREHLVAPEGAEERLAWERLSEAEGERMVAAIVRETLRRKHSQARLRGLAEDEDVVLDVAPEAARLSFEPHGATFFYPDPPLGHEEQDLLKRIWPKNRFETPMMRLAQRYAKAFQGKSLAVSVSESPDLAQHGLTDHHQRLLTDEIHLYLMLAGLRIVYGGKLEPDKLDDPDNFTLRLFQLARGHSGLARDAGAALEPIINAAPWPLWKLYDHNVATVFGNLAKLDKVPRPGFGPTDEDLGANDQGFVPPGSPLQLYAWSRALTHMREKVTDETVGRLCIGGILEGYKGRLAGLVEEPLTSLRAKKPLFLVGALGGCTELVIDLLEQRDRDEMTERVAEEKVKDHKDILALYEEYGGEPLLRDQVAAEIKGYGQNGPAEALNNGLDDNENRELFTTWDPHRIATLILTGLERLS